MHVVTIKKTFKLVGAVENSHKARGWGRRVLEVSAAIRCCCICWALNKNDGRRARLQLTQFERCQRGINKESRRLIDNSANYPRTIIYRDGRGNFVHITPLQFRVINSGTKVLFGLDKRDSPSANHDNS